MIRNKLLDQQLITMSFFNTPLVAFNLFYVYNFKSVRIVKSSFREF